AAGGPGDGGAARGNTRTRGPTGVAAGLLGGRHVGAALDEADHEKRARGRAGAGARRTADRTALGAARGTRAGARAADITGHGAEQCPQPARATGAAGGAGGGGTGLAGGAALAGRSDAGGEQEQQDAQRRPAEGRGHTDWPPQFRLADRTRAATI